METKKYFGLEYDDIYEFFNIILGYEGNELMNLTSISNLEGTLSDTISSILEFIDKVSPDFIYETEQDEVSNLLYLYIISKYYKKHTLGYLDESDNFNDSHRSFLKLTEWETVLPIKTLRSIESLNMMKDIIGDDELFEEVIHKDRYEIYKSTDGDIFEMLHILIKYPNLMVHRSSFFFDENSHIDYNYIDLLSKDFETKRDEILYILGQFTEKEIIKFFKHKLVNPITDIMEYYLFIKLLELGSHLDMMRYNAVHKYFKDLLKHKLMNFYNFQPELYDIIMSINLPGYMKHYDIRIPINISEIIDILNEYIKE